MENNRNWKEILARGAWLLLGLIALGLGLIGVVIPGLPTTPFILLAAFAFARSSDRWHAWLVNHPVFGPLIKNWRKEGAISTRAKIYAILAMVLVLALSVVMQVPAKIVGLKAVVLIGAAIFILTRPRPSTELKAQKEEGD